jgi:hypothetical protein
VADRLSVWRQAFHDTERFRGHFLFFLGWEVIGAAACAAAAFLLEPTAPTKFQQAAYPVVGVVVGAIIAYTLLYLWHVALAPVQQRNEAWRDLDAMVIEKPRAPSFPVNRDALAAQVAVVQQAARKVINSWRAGIKSGKPLQTRDPVYKAFQQACDALEVQAFVAGPEFQGKVMFFKLSTEITLLTLHMNIVTKTADEPAFDNASVEVGTFVNSVSEMLNKGLS